MKEFREIDIIATLKERDGAMQLATSTYDVGTLEAMLPDDFVLIASSGKTFTKADVLAETADRTIVWHNNDTSNLTVRVYNDACGVVIADLHQRFERNGEIVDARLRYTDTWAFTGGAWRYVSGHATRLPKEGHDDKRG